MTKDNLVGALSHAITVREAFYKINSKAAKNNNPGNLRDEETEDGYAHYNTAAAGWKALDRHIVKQIGKGVTLVDFFTDRNKPQSYAIFVASYIKKNFGWSIPLDKPLNSLCS